MMGDAADYLIEQGQEATWLREQGLLDEWDDDTPEDCPDCGKSTVVRQNRRNKLYFTGCGAYPKCKWSTS